jgi:hypothetical protein
VSVGTSAFTSRLVPDDVSTFRATFTTFTRAHAQGSNPKQTCYCSFACLSREMGRVCVPVWMSPRRRRPRRPRRSLARRFGLTSSRGPGGAFGEG